MLHVIKNVLRYKAWRISPPPETAPPEGEFSCNHCSEESFTAEAVTNSQNFHSLYKAELPFSWSSSSGSSADPLSSITCSKHASATETVDSPIELADMSGVSGRVTMNSPVPHASLSVAGASFQVKTNVLTAANKLMPETISKNLRIDESSAHSGSTSKPGPSNLCRRLKAKCQKFVALMIALGVTASSEIVVDSIEAGQAGVGDEADDKEDVDEKDNNDDEDEEHQGPSYPRSDWKAIHAISDDRIERLVTKKLSSDGKLQVTSRTFGSYNLVAIIANTAAADPEPEYVIRIPSHGTLSHWTEEDAYMLEREVQLVEYIRRNTKVPVPQILTYCSDCDNEVGAPFILMTKLPGKSAYDIWFDLPYSASEAFRDADVPSIATEKKRVNFLRSLARTMTELQTLSFDRIGMPEITDDGRTVVVGPSYVWGEDDEDIDNASERPAFSTTRMYVGISLARNFKVNPRDEKTAFWYRQLGARKILDIAFSQPVFKAPSSDPETFTIHHNDLDLQNILVDDEGNVTGIIDWDNSYAGPRCIGASAVPIFLRSDWFPRYTHDLRITPHMGWNEHYYRQVYAAAMVEAGNPDAKYTLKSAIYQAGICALYEGGDYRDFIEKLIRYIPECRIDVEDLEYGLGMQWPAATEMLKRQFRTIFEPQLPAAGILDSLDKELALNEWWCDFDELLEFYEEEGEVTEEFSDNEG